MRGLFLAAESDPACSVGEDRMGPLMSSCAAGCGPARPDNSIFFELEGFQWCAAKGAFAILNDRGRFLCAAPPGAAGRAWAAAAWRGAHAPADCCWLRRDSAGCRAPGSYTRIESARAPGGWRLNRLGCELYVDAGPPASGQAASDYCWQGASCRAGAAACRLK